jgi:predicted aspartyl protease
MSVRAIVFLALASAACGPAEPAVAPSGLDPFVQALQAADATAAAAVARGAEEVRCAATFRKLASDGVVATFDDLCALAETGASQHLRNWAARALLAGLRAEGQWDRLATLRAEHPGIGLQVDAIPPAMLALHTPRFDPVGEAVPLQLAAAAAADGWLVVSCELRGPSSARTLPALLDTGAATCVMSASLAEQLGVVSVSDAPLRVIGITGAVSEGKAAMLDRLQFGGLVAHGVPVSVLPDDVLAPMLGERSFMVGWEVLQQVALEIDLLGGTLTVGPATPTGAGEQNLFLLGEPVVRLSCNGQPALFLLDTGTGQTQFYTASAERLGLPTAAQREEELRGIGGVTRAQVTKLGKIVLRSGDVELSIEGLAAVRQPGPHELLRVDGTLGMDLIGAVRATIDGKARRMRMRQR